MDRSLNKARQDDRINNDLRIKRSHSFDEEKNNEVISYLGEESVPIEERIQNFSDFCEKFSFTLTEEQTNYMVQLVIAAMSEGDTELADSFLLAIRIILSYGEESCISLFLESERLDVIMNSFPLVNAYKSAGILVAFSEEAAQIVWQYSEKIDFNSLVYQEDEEQTAAVSPDEALSFLSEFNRYSAFAELLLPIIDTSILLWLKSDSDSKIRYEVLRYLYFTIKQSKEIALLLVGHLQFYTLFQSPPDTVENYTIVLKVLKVLCEQTEDPENAIINQNLLPFIYVTIKNDNDSIVSLGCDLIGTIALNSGEEGFAQLLSFNMIDELLEISDERSLICGISALNALLRFFVKGDEEIKTYLIDKDFFSQLANNMTVDNDTNAGDNLYLIASIIANAQIEQNQKILAAIYENEDVIDAIGDFSQSTSERCIDLANSILSRE